MSDNECFPSEIEDDALKVIGELIPSKSRERYEGTFKKYEEWCKKMGTVDLTSEKVLLAYFNDLSKDHKSSTLWSYYSMIRAMISVKINIDISKYFNLMALLKRKSVGYKPIRSKTFERHDITKFLLEANDDQFLFTKVAFIIGLAGACRKQELTDLTIDNVKDEGNFFHFYVLNTETKMSRGFFVTAGNMEGVNLVILIRKYIRLRPKKVNHKRFFVQYRNGCCTTQPVGINSFGSVPRKIAMHLKLSNPDLYTGDCFRRSAKSLLVKGRCNYFAMKRHRGSKSSILDDEEYAWSSVENKLKIATQILGGCEGKNTSIGHRIVLTSSSEDSAAIVQKHAESKNESSIGEEGCSGYQQPPEEKRASDLEPVAFVPVSSIKEEPLEIIDHGENEGNQMDLFSEIEDAKPSLEIESCEPDVSNFRTYSKRSAATHTVTQPSKTIESMLPPSEEKNDDIKDLKNVVKKLESITEKLAASKFEDQYDQFGKYLGTLLRGVPKKKYLKLKIKLITDVMQARMSSEGGVDDFTNKSVDSMKSSKPNVPTGINTIPSTATSSASGNSATSDKAIRPQDRRVVFSNNPVILKNLSLSTSSGSSSVMLPTGPKSPVMNIGYPTSIPHTSTVFVPLTLARAQSMTTNLEGSQHTSIPDVPPLALLPSKTITSPLIVTQPDKRLTKEDENKADMKDSDSKPPQQHSKPVTTDVNISRPTQPAKVYRSKAVIKANDGGTSLQQFSKTVTSTGICSQSDSSKYLKVYPSKAVIRNDNGSTPSQQHSKTVVSNDQSMQPDTTHTIAYQNTAEIRRDDGDTTLPDPLKTPDTQPDSTHTKHPCNTDTGDDGEVESIVAVNIKEENSQWCVEDEEEMDIEEGKELEIIKQDVDPLGNDFQDQAQSEHEAVTLEPPDPGEIEKAGTTSSNEPETHRFYCELCPSSYISTSFVSSNQLKLHFSTVHPGCSPRWKTTHSPIGDEKTSKRKCPENSTSPS